MELDVQLHFKFRAIRLENPLGRRKRRTKTQRTLLRDLTSPLVEQVSNVFQYVFAKSMDNILIASPQSDFSLGGPHEAP
jgi:hypothetical protein